MGHACRKEPHCCAARALVGRAALCPVCSCGRAASKWDWCLPGGRSSLGWLLQALPGWAKTWLRKLGGSPFVYLAAKSDTTAGPGGLSAGLLPQGGASDCFVSEGDGASGALESSQPVGPRVGWGGFVLLPFFLNREFHVTLAPLVPIPLLGSLSNGLFFFCLKGAGRMCLFCTSDWNLSLPECSACLCCYPL